MRPKTALWLLPVSAVAALSIATLLFRVFAPFDDLVFDAFYKLRPRLRPSPRVAMVTLDEDSLTRHGPWPWSPDRARSLVAGILDRGASVVVIVDPVPEDVMRELLSLGPDVIVPCRLRLDPHAEEPLRLAGPPPRGSGVSLVLTERGVARSQPLDYSIAGERVSSVDRLALERFAEVAPDAIGNRERLERASVEPNYVGPPRSFPSVRAALVLSGEVDRLEPPPLRDRIVLVGLTDVNVAHTFETPTTDALLMPAVEVHASVIHTVIEGSELLPLGAARNITLVLFFSVALSFAYRVVKPAGGIAIFVAGLIGYPLASYVAFAYLGIRLAQLPFLVLFSLLYLNLSFFKVADLDLGLSELVEDLGARARDPRLQGSEPKSQSDAASKDLAAGGAGASAAEPGTLDEMRFAFAASLLGAESMLLFRRDGGTRLALALSHGARSEDVRETSRDVRRGAFREAARAGEPLLRADFMQAARGVLSLVVPLEAASGLVGFLVVNHPAGRERAFAEGRHATLFVARQLALALGREAGMRRGAGTPGTLVGLVTRDQLRARLRAASSVSHQVLEQRDLLLSILDGVNQGVVVCDAFGRIFLTNRKFDEIVADVSQGVQPWNLIDVACDLTGADRGEMLAKLREVLLRGVAHAFEVKASRKRGRRFHRLGVVAVRETLGAVAGGSAGIADGPAPVLGVVGLLTDITEHRELDEMKTNLLSMLSYKILNVLTSIQGYSEILVDSPNMPAEEREHAKVINVEANALAKIFEDVHGLANFATNEKGLKRVPLNLVALVQDTLRTSEEACERKRLKVAWHAPEKVNIVMADKTMMEKALQRIVAYTIENALREGELRVKVEEEERYLRVDVENQGYGVPDEALPRLFARPAGGDGGGGGGSGEGLAAGGDGLHEAREAVEMNGGIIDVESAVGEGVRFHIWIPIFLVD